MKPTKFFSALMMLAMGIFCLSLSSCSDDDDEPAIAAAKAIEASYTADMTCSVMGSESIFEDVTFNVTAIDDATAKIEISSFGEAPMKVPAITIENVKVSGTDGNYTIATTNFEGDLANGKKYSGVLQGSFANNTINIQFNLNYGAMPMPLICTFTAPKK